MITGHVAVGCMPGCFFVSRKFAKSYDRINLTMPKGEKDKIKAHAEVMGESVNGFIQRAISQAIEKDRGN